jgi:hypothetical protein
MTHLIEAINFIKDTFSNATSAGTSFNNRELLQAKIKLSPPAYDQLEDAFNYLIREGFLTSNHNLTDQGFKELFPSNLSHVKNKLFNEFRAQQLRAGHVVNSRSLLHNFLMKANDQEKQDFEIVLDGLINDGFLQEENGNLKLTEYGYKNLY